MQSKIQSVHPSSLRQPVDFFTFFLQNTGACSASPPALLPVYSLTQLILLPYTALTFPQNMGSEKNLGQKWLIGQKHCFKQGQG